MSSISRYSASIWSSRSGSLPPGAKSTRVDSPASMRTNTPVGSTKKETPWAAYDRATSSRMAVTRSAASPARHIATPSWRRKSSTASGGCSTTGAGTGAGTGRGTRLAATSLTRVQKRWRRECGRPSHLPSVRGDTLRGHSPGTGEGAPSPADLA